MWQDNNDRKLNATARKRDKDQRATFGKGVRVTLTSTVNDLPVGTVCVIHSQPHKWDRCGKYTVRASVPIGWRLIEVYAAEMRVA